MENGQHLHVSPAAGFLVKPVDQRGRARSHNDIMTQRLKNRERQRRYRARKRNEADKKKLGVVNQPTLLRVEMQVVDIPNNPVSRVYCQRNWKKDARRAHLFKEQQVKSHGLAFSDPVSSNASQAEASCLVAGTKVDRPLISEFYSTSAAIVDTNQTPRATPCRRHWKAEARNKKN